MLAHAALQAATSACPCAGRQQRDRHRHGWARPRQQRVLLLRLTPPHLHRPREAATPIMHTHERSRKALLSVSSILVNLHMQVCDRGVSQHMSCSAPHVANM